MKHYYKHSDTCDCKYVQTYDGNVWGSEETYTNPEGKVYQTVKCQIHQDIPFEELDNVVRVKEANARMLTVIELAKNPKLKDIPLEDLMQRAKYSGNGDSRQIEFQLPELTENEKQAEISKINFDNVKISNAPIVK